ncbi:hypothetical protein PspS35_14720 [Pseudomonas sp. S35]|nr:hypothetical protein PspS35_14590 [Pseudomonas sp. S35]QHF44959.1 hypothetical protein PspS35_14655 [Pseudomonas sp. S35]QHF44972.1 hypothetical protein PspS35_14720 [Pseudomonas sp. S35]
MKESSPSKPESPSPPLPPSPSPPSFPPPGLVPPSPPSPGSVLGVRGSPTDGDLYPDSAPHEGLAVLRPTK